jgi:putative flippase GtrA
MRAGFGAADNSESRADDYIRRVEAASIWAGRCLARAGGPNSQCGRIHLLSVRHDVSPVGVTSHTLVQFIRYCVVGGCGFFVEAALIAFLQYRWGWTALPCRAASFPVAVAVTWWLNHRYTFGTGGGWPELLRYLSTQGVGMLVNLCAYTAVIWIVPELDLHALVPLVIGSALGLAVNFVLARRWVFRAGKR